MEPESELEDAQLTLVKKQQEGQLGWTDLMKYPRAAYDSTIIEPEIGEHNWG
jgi:hypothetical protein